MQLSPAVGSFNALIVSLDHALKVRLSESTLKTASEFARLDPEDLAAILPYSEFPKPFMWIEWDNTNHYVPAWPPFKQTEKQIISNVGLLVSTSADRRSGRIDIVTDLEEIFMFPLSLLFNWRKTFEVPEEVISQLRQNIENSEHIEKSGVYFSDKRVESLLEIRRRFGIEPSQFLDIPPQNQDKMQHIYETATEFLVAAEPFIVGIANILECCRLDDSRITELHIH